MSSSPSSPLTPPAAPGRYVKWVRIAVRQLTCPVGHTFTPDLRVRAGKGDVTCRYVSAPGHPICGRQLLVMSIRGHDHRLVAEVSDADLAFMEAEAMSPDREIAYLLCTPVRTASVARP